MKQLKETLYKKAILTSDANMWKKYKEVKNLYVNKINSVKNNSVQIKINNCGNNQKLLWKTLKKEVLPNKNTQVLLDYIEFNGYKERIMETVANKFNKYFVESIVSINNSIEFFTYNNTLSNFSVEEFKFVPITMSKLIEIVESTKGSGENNVSAKVIVDSMDSVGDFLLNLINSSLIYGVVPKSWKESIITPIQKKINTKKSEEFRPINKLPVPEKILESVVKEQLQLHIDRNNILIDEQSGFRRENSCESALNMVISDWKELDDKGEVIIVLFLDFKRAFSKQLIGKYYYLNCKIME